MIASAALDRFNELAADPRPSSPTWLAEYEATRLAAKAEYAAMYDAAERRCHAMSDHDEAARRLAELAESKDGIREAFEFLAEVVAIQQRSVARTIADHALGPRP